MEEYPHSHQILVSTNTIMKIIIIFFFCKKTETHLKDCETSSVIRKIKKNIKHLLIFAKTKTNFSISRNWHQNVAATQRTLSLILNMTLSIKITTLMFI